MQAEKSFPLMIKAAQKFENPKIDDLPAAVKAELERLELQEKIRPGDRIAVTAGSRGISQIPLIIRGSIELLLSLGAKPFIVPAMGSHGGATAEGQLAVLERLGITEESAGAPIFSSMEVVQAGMTPSGHPVYMDRYAWEADGVLVINRVKAHTSMVEDIESGLMKMISIGLGKEKGCSLIHSVGLGKTVPEAARITLATGKILGGLAVIENSREEVALLAAVKPEEMEETEKKLLIIARELIPRLPFAGIDVLIVEEIGKNISGTGMDTKTIGRLMLHNLADPPQPRVKIIVVLDLSRKTGGNAMGIGLADITTRKLVEKIDYKELHKNALAAGILNRARVPMAMESDREAIGTALRVAGDDPAALKVVRIRNTLELQELYFSKALEAEARANAALEILSAPLPIVFDEQGNLL